MPKASDKDGSSKRVHLKVAFVASSLLLILSVVGAYRAFEAKRAVERGISSPLLSVDLPVDAALYGVNAALEQYEADSQLDRALELMQTAGFDWIRQRFPWDVIEPEAGYFDWEPWDRIVSRVEATGMRVVAVPHTSPQWARRPADRDNRFAPPQYISTFGLFVRALARRYAGRIAAYEIWDEPNIYPNWGETVQPAEYVALLALASREVRAADPDALVLTAGLAPTTEVSDRNMNDVLFLRGMYAAGAQGRFDVLSVKPYGFWSGPEDRRVDPEVLNLSRVILLREEMVRHGDGALPVWAVEFGWNTLPDSWQGRPSPWGTDTLARQSERIAQAVGRMREEWGWVQLVCWADFQPAVAVSSPRWGFALVNPQLEPTTLYDVVRSVISEPVVGPNASTAVNDRRLGLLSLTTALLGATAAWLGARMPWAAWSKRLDGWYAERSELSQWLIIIALLLGYQLSPHSPAALATLVVAGWFIRLRLDIGLACLIFSAPFFLYPVRIGSKAFSMVESLTLTCALAWFFGQAWRGWTWRSPARIRLRAFQELRRLSSLDLAVLGFLLLGAVSIGFSVYRGVSLREFRVVVFEPVLFYFLVRAARLDEHQLERLADALVLAGLAVTLFGLYQYVFTDDVIVADGVARMRSVYGSPNNLSLLLGRLVPLAAAVALWGTSRRRLLHGLALIVMMVGLMLTYSRGGWLLALPVGLLVLGLAKGRRATVVTVLVLVLCVAVMLGLAGSQRLVSLLNLGEGTTFIRLKLWQAAVAMIRDHPLLGVGLDNFLYVYPDYILPEAWREPDLSHPHNLILDYWTRLGLGGVIVCLFLLVGFFRQSCQLYGDLPRGDGHAIILGTLAGMSAAVAHGLVDNFYFLVDLAFVYFAFMAIVRSWPGHPPAVQVPQADRDGVDDG